MRIASGIDSRKYEGHNFRMWAATTQQCNAACQTLNQDTGKESAAYALYVWTPEDRLCAVAHNLVQDHGWKGLIATESAL